MNQIFPIFAKVGVVGGTLVVLVAVGLSLVIAVVLLTCGQRKKAHREPARDPVAAPDTFPDGRLEARPSDKEIIEKLPRQYRELFPENISSSYAMKPGWLFEEVLLGKLDGDNQRCDELLRKLIELSDGVFVAAATVGDTFTRKRMHTNSELPDDMRVTIVKRRGLIRCTTGEVLIDAEVA